MNNTRRNFLKSAALGSSSFFVSSGMIASNQKESHHYRKNKVIYRTLGKTGIKLPVVSMGVMRADNPNLVKAALEKGIVHLDTAHGYQGGRNEEMLGKVLKGKARDSYVISTKVPGGPKNKETGSYDKDLSVKDFLEKLDTSLKRLQIDYVDLFYLHATNHRNQVLYEPLLKAMESAKKAGKIKHIAVSTHSNEPEVIQAAIDSKIYEVVLTAYNFKQHHNDKMNKVLEAANQAGLGIVAMKTMAGGFHDKEKKDPVNTKAALKWALQNPNVHTAIPGFTTYEHLEDSFSVMQNLKLSKQEKFDLFMKEGQGSLYCQQCEVCLPQCKQKLPIPDLMRAYMYTYGYQNPKDAQHLLSTLNLPENPCQDCNLCTIKCTSGFNIQDKIKDISRLRDVPTEFLG